MITDISHPAKLRAVCNTQHARARAAERYGLDLTYRDVTDIAGRIKINDPSTVPLSGRSGDGRLRVAVWIDGVWYPVAYDPATETVVSFLPEGVLDPYRSYLDGLRVSG